MSETEIFWIYHERQQAALCGQHALNNLLQGAKFTTDQLRRDAMALDQIELNMYGPPGSPARLARMREGSSNVDGYGNFSVQVLQRALGNFPSGSIELTNIVDERVRKVEPTNIEGFICHKEAHWFAIRKINGRFWNLNSFLPKPETISHFKLAAEIANLQKKAYLVFAALPPGWQQGGKLPEVSMKRSNLPKSRLKYYWNCNILLEDEAKLGHKGNINYADKKNHSFDDQGKTEIKDRANATQDPWMDVGNGQTLGSMKKEGADLAQNYVKLDEYTNLSLNEPKKGIRMQLRLPQNKRAVKVFSEDETVAHVYKAVFDLCKNQPPGKNLQLSAGYPPKVLAEGGKTVVDAGLSGVSVACKWI